MKNACYAVIIWMMFLPAIAIAQNLKIETLGTGSAFTCLSYDAEGNLWAGTYKQGLWKSSPDNNGNSGPLQLFSTDANFNNYVLQTIATPTVNGRTSVWVGTYGLSAGTASGGGVYHFLTTNTTVGEFYSAERDPVVAAGMKVPPMKNDGLPSRDSKAIVVDKYGTVWSAHGYHHLTTSGSYYTVYDPFNMQPHVYYSPAGYYLTPGGLGRKAHDEGVFNNLATTSMPYPAYTINTPLDKSAGTRRCISLACTEDQIWMGYQAYEIHGGGFKYPGIARYDLNGNLIDFLDYTNTPELPFAAGFGPFVTAMHFQKNGDPWIAFNLNKGFAVKKNFIYTNAAWEYVEQLLHYNSSTGTQEPSTLLPNGIRFNVNAPNTITSLGRRVVLGTLDGLLIYDGRGDVHQDSSYTLITTADGLSSNNIMAVDAGGGFLYVATDQGVHKIFIPGDLEVFHIAKKETPFDNSKGKNYESMATLLSESLLNNLTVSDRDLPLFSADGTTSSVFRLYTDDFDGFYQGKYSFGIDQDYEGKDTAKYGKLILRPIGMYEDGNKEYVDFIYRHPLYIEQQFRDAATDPEYYLTVVHKSNLRMVFKHKIKITLPPVLLVHGVWSNIKSLAWLEDGLRAEANYQPFKTLKIYKTADGDAEYPFSHDARFIPEGIKKLISTCRTNNMSAGKVSLVVHSRGGLYSRAYIEEIEPGIPFNHDVHCLITLNTPHSGSQQANLVLDERQIRVVVPRYISTVPGIPNSYETKILEVGKLFDFPVPPRDTAEKNGALVLRVNKGFIPQLNLNKNLQKIKNYKVPVHAVATKFSLCQLNQGNCDFSDIDPKNLVGPVHTFKFRLALEIAKYGLGMVFESFDDFEKHIFNGELNDFVVPQSSMEAGLGERFISTFPGLNVAHTPSFAALGAEGVTTSPIVRARVIELLGQNMFDGSSNFSLEGFDPPRKEKGNELEYKFWPSLGPLPPGTRARKSAVASEEVRMFILRDFSHEYNVGDTLKLKLVTSQVNNILIAFERTGTEDGSLYLDSKIVAGDTTYFSFVIPSGYNGNFGAIAYGFNQSGLVAMDQMSFYAGIPDSISLTDIYFDHYSETVELEGSGPYRFVLKGVFSDGNDRVITDMEGVRFYLTDSTILSGAGIHSLRAAKTGHTFLVGVYNNKIDSLRFMVYEAQVSDTTLLGDFFITPVEEDQLFVEWSTLQEFACEKFDLQYSQDKLNFETVQTIAGNGTSLDQNHYNFNLYHQESKQPVYFRLAITDSVRGKVAYSQILELIPSSLVTATFDFEPEIDKGFNLYPNPARGERITLVYESEISDPSATLEIISLNGKVLNRSEIPVTTGPNSIPVILPEYITPGIYLIRLSAGESRYTQKISINR